MKYLGYIIIGLTILFGISIAMYLSSKKKAEQETKPIKKRGVQYVY